jgi:hypothetical protein
MRRWLLGPYFRNQSKEINTLVVVSGSMADVKRRIRAIEERNRRVELDKAWETSWIRRIIIAVFTYLVVVLFFFAASLPNPFLNSIVPTVAFVLSTLSLPFFKRIWMDYFLKKKL